jgi:hypothetical protein
MSIEDYWEKIKPGLPEALTLILVALLAFGLGRLSKIEAEREPIRIETATPAATASNDVAPQTIPASPTGTTGGEVVASKSGKVYYLPWCSGVKRIKAANLVTFPSAAVAAAAGLTPAKNCPGLTGN